jgi:hypothetical protein
MVDLTDFGQARRKQVRDSSIGVTALAQIAKDFGFAGSTPGT